ncbi:hypothetical protein [Bradyrhizobium sp. 164]|uniref:hypothetical protein n=1 Tax=Bradyrhizobium sp. 164 TaxID=2782637 RepID=UPI001FF7644C|nr:hypothetical protein [Bradyrhizobium sp. 164]
MFSSAISATGRPVEWEFQRGEEVIPFAASGRLLAYDTGSLIGSCLGGIGVAQLLELYAKAILAEGKLVHLLPDWSDECQTPSGTAPFAS